MKLVEVIRTEQTDPTVFQKAYDWVGEIGKVAVSCGDTPGFIVNRLLVPSLMQALLMVDRQDATVKDIDVSMQLGAGHPMGPYVHIRVEFPPNLPESHFVFSFFFFFFFDQDSFG